MRATSGDDRLNALTFEWDGTPGASESIAKLNGVEIARNLVQYVPGAVGAVRTENVDSDGVKWYVFAPNPEPQPYVGGMRVILPLDSLKQGTEYVAGAWVHNPSDVARQFRALWCDLGHGIYTIPAHTTAAVWTTPASREYDNVYRFLDIRPYSPTNDDREPFWVRQATVVEAPWDDPQPFDGDTTLSKASMTLYAPLRLEAIAGKPWEYTENVTAFAHPGMLTVIFVGKRAPIESTQIMLYQSTPRISLYASSVGTAVNGSLEGIGESQRLGDSFFSATIIYMGLTDLRVGGLGTASPWLGPFRTVAYDRQLTQTQIDQIIRHLAATL